MKIPAPVTLPKPVGNSFTPLVTLQTILRWHGVNQKILAQRSGYSAPLISQVFRGRRAATRPFVESFAEVFQLPPAFLDPLPSGEPAPAQPKRRAAKKCPICGHWKVDLDEHKQRRHGDQPEPVAPGPEAAS